MELIATKTKRTFILDATCLYLKIIITKKSNFSSFYTFQRRKKNKSSGIRNIPHSCKSKFKRNDCIICDVTWRQKVNPKSWVNLSSRVIQTGLGEGVTPVARLWIICSLWTTSYVFTEYFSTGEILLQQFYRAHIYRWYGPWEAPVSRRPW